MNTQLLLSSYDIKTICCHVTIIVLILAITYLIRPVVLLLFRQKPEKEVRDNTPEETKDDIAVKHELDRQNRVRAIMREICELTKDFDTAKGNDGQYNDAMAQKLFELYKEIDAHVKLPINVNGNE